MSEEDKVRYIELKLNEIKKSVEEKDKEIEKLNKLFSIEKDYRERFDKDNQKLHSIIKEVREYIDRRDIEWGSKEHNYVLEILDKGE